MIDGLVDCPACGGIYTVKVHSGDYTEGNWKTRCSSCKAEFEVTLTLRELPSKEVGG